MSLFQAIVKIYITRVKCNSIKQYLRCKLHIPQKYNCKPNN